MKKIYLLTVILLVGFSACKLDPNWDVDALAPIAETTLTPANLIPEGDMVPDTSGKLHYVFDKVVYSVPLDSLFDIPDSTYTYGFVAPISFTVQPGFPATIFDGYISPNINTATLTELVVLSGGIEIKATSFAPQPTVLNFTLPKATKNGQPFSASRNLEAAASGSSVSFTEYIDLSGYTINLTGDDGLQGNRLKMSISATIDPQGQAFAISAGQPLVNCDIKLADIKPYYAKGVVNTQEIKVDADTVRLKVLEMVKSGTVNVEDINLTLTLTNGLGVDLQALIYQMAGTSPIGGQVSLVHPSINNAININRAQSNLYQEPAFTPSVKTIQFTNVNSNLKAFIENLPTAIAIDAKFIVNPYGNISGGNDFVYYNGETSLALKVEAPVAFALNNLVLVDTFDLNLNVKDNQPVKAATLKAHVDNGFPLGALLQVYYSTADDLLVDSLFFDQEIAPAVTGTDLKVVSPTYSVLSANAKDEKLTKLLKSNKLWFKVKLNTTPSAQLVSFYDGYKMDVKLTAQFTYGL